MVLVAILVVLIVAIVTYARRRRTEGHKGTVPSVGNWPPDSGSLGDERQWQPPQQPAPPAPPAGPLLRVAIVEARAGGPDLLVSWNAINSGTVPLRVQWSAPR